MSNYGAYVPQVHFEQIPIKNLVSNQDYQRNLSQKHIAQAANHFDPYQINPVKVSRRDGINYVFNGQHTIEIVAAVSGSRETPVWCMIYDDLNYAREANIFANQMKYVKALTPIEIFMANIEAGNDEQLMIRDLVETYDLTISANKQPGNICAVSALESIFEKYGFHVLDRVLRLCLGTWEGDIRAFTGTMMNAVARLIVAYGDTLDDATFKARLGCISLLQIMRTAKERRPGAMGYAEALVLAYNGRRKNETTKLSMRKLYANERVTNVDPDIFDDEDAVDDAPDEFEEDDEMITGCAYEALAM